MGKGRWMGKMSHRSALFLCRNLTLLCQVEATFFHTHSLARKAAAKAGVNPPSSTGHTLRHNYATHLLERGIRLCYIQDLPGHSSGKTTENHFILGVNIQTHVSGNTLIYRI